MACTFFVPPGSHWASKIVIKHTCLKLKNLFIQDSKYWIFSIRMKSSRLHWISLDLVWFRNFDTSVTQSANFVLFFQVRNYWELVKVERAFSYLTVISWANFLTNHEQFSKLCKKANISQQNTGYKRRSSKANLKISHKWQSLAFVVKSIWLLLVLAGTYFIQHQIIVF